MAKTIDVNKLKSDAFSAIDAFFGEDDDSVEVEAEVAVDETSPKSELIVSSIDDFAILDEFILALDWEYSEDEINRFVEHLDNIGVNNPDPYNQALVKMLNSIITYLIKAKNQAYPETFNILSAVIAVLKKINAPGFDSMLVKSEVSKAYGIVKDLKQKISDYNAKLEKNLMESGEFTPMAPRKAQLPSPESAKLAESGHEVITIQSSDFIDEDDIFIEKSKPFEAAPTFSEAMDFEKIESRIIGRMEQYEKRLAFLEEQNKTLRQIITDQKENQHKVQPPSEDVEFEIDDFAAELAAFAPVNEPDILTVSPDEIIFDESTTEAGLEDPEFTEEIVKSDTGEKHIPGDEIQSMTVEESQPQPVESDESGEPVRLFNLGSEAIAIPVDYVNNLYKLPGKIKKRIHSMDSVPLGDLSSMFQKLSKNMSGSLKEIKERELKKISAGIHFPTSDKIDYKYAVLCSYNNEIVIVPITGRHDMDTGVKGRRKKLKNRLSEFSIDIIDNDLILPLIIPC